MIIAIKVVRRKVVADRPHGRIGLIAFCTIIALACLGCNTSRYGASYDQRLPGIRQVHILPVQVKIESIHTGNMREARPDITREVRPRLLSEIQRVTQGKNVVVTLSDWEEADEREGRAVPQSLALAHAIEQSIRTHHYLYGDARIFDYTIAETVKELALESGDAFLMVHLVGAVPTPGRVGLAVTAAIVGGLTGVNIPVQTHYCELSLMLVDAHTGEVLWYNIFISEANVRNKRTLRKIVKKVSKHMLEPWKK